MGNYSEDSIHASIIFSLFPDANTAQALRAKAYTLVPQNWTIFLSQRKRWALGSISNEFVMIFRPGIILVERLQSIIAVATWAMTPFIITAVGELIYLFARKGLKLFDNRVFLGLMCVLFLRYVGLPSPAALKHQLLLPFSSKAYELTTVSQIYSFCIGFWLPRNAMERFQYFFGYFVHFLMSPFVNIIILVYSLYHADDFKWGKTRQVILSAGDSDDPDFARNAH